MLNESTVNRSAYSPASNSHASTEMRGTQEKRSDVVADIATMLSREFAVYSAHRIAAMAADLEMPVNDLKALELINAFEAISTGQLGQMMGISSGGVTALITRLETGGYVERVRHPLDRRVIAIRVKAEKKQMLEHLPSMLGEQAELSATRYELSQLETVQAYLAQCVKALKREASRSMDMSYARL